MNKIESQLCHNIKELEENKLSLGEKLDIIKDSKNIYKDAQILIQDAQKQIDNYIPNKGKIDNIENTINDIENGLENFDKLDLENSVDLYMELMNKISSLDSFVSNEIGTTEILEDSS